MSGYSVLINTCDKFEDCWEPYFKLHTIYWPQKTTGIYLNTELKEFQYPGLEIVSIKNTRNEPPGTILTWSECLLRALDACEDSIVLYMQEDYFLKASVKSEIVEKYVDLMLRDESVHCIHLTDQAVIPGQKSKYEGLHTVKLKQRYRVSCQAALWRKDVLRSYLRAHESAWQFEEFGSKRGALVNHNFYVVDPGWVSLNKFEIIPYVFTGIVQGRWFEEVPPLFARHGIEMNYSSRGFVQDAPKRTFTTKLTTFWKRAPVATRSYLDLWRLKR